MFEPVVELINRVRDKDGQVVPWEGRFGGDPILVREKLSVPIGVARILIQQSMFRQEPDTMRTEYRLGCEALRCPTDLIPQSEVERLELIDRELLGPDRQFGAPVQVGKRVMTLQPVKRAYRPQRTEPISVSNPGQSDGAFPGAFERP